MRNENTLFMILVILTFTLAQAQPHEYNNHYYVLSNETHYWQNAKPECERQGGYLVSINDDGERDFLYALSDQLNPSTNIWIGLSGTCYSSTRRCDSFVWEDGNPWNSFNWHPDYPTTGRYSYYVQIDKETKQWKNVGSRIGRDYTHDKRFYICEFVRCFNTSNPCYNGGVCSAIELSHLFTCDCTNTGYRGCEEEGDECESNPCLNGLCIDLFNGFTCECDGTGFEGVYCERELNECESNPCLHGEGVDAVKQYMCNCGNSGYTGTLCETEIDECVSSPCVLGTCINELNRYTCDCEGSGYSGVHCELDINDCASDPCVNGHCSNEVNMYSCNCDGSGFTGDLCEMGINECASDPCVNGQCNNEINKYQCNCDDSGFRGDLCETDINECASNPCLHGYCINGLNQYTCHCDNTGFTGTHCESELDECLSEPCVHGSCTDDINAYTCNCTHPGYTGAQCDQDVDECLRDNLDCHNGSCVNTEGSFECRCLPGFSGRLCSDDVDECVHVNICSLRGFCINTIGSFNCICLEGFLGKTCQHKEQSEYRETTAKSESTLGKTIQKGESTLSDNGFAVGFIITALLFITFIIISVTVFLCRRKATKRKQEQADHSNSPALDQEKIKGGSDCNPADVSLELNDNVYQNDDQHYLACGDVPCDDSTERQYEQLETSVIDTYEIKESEPYTELASADMHRGSMPTYDI